MPRPYPLALAVVALGLMAGCTQFPELDAQIAEQDRNATYPDLIPVEDITSGIPPKTITPQTGEDLDLRAEALRSRADRLRGDVIDEDTRRRMQTGIDS
ncbi:hypothetical protein SAMN05443999_10930 [Roseovarius azorensis]|uniref:Uncharacterized protein n=1 Tax=Roseovarius azorensis TaxID=1287727 RepID=A0A1H7TTA8_9RHOB|nr:hypothetical protein [Roseovarius azorensis]SEL87714.1 hypothetical protein SAMN05443999_10930 [Roseovarius azorensis]